MCGIAGYVGKKKLNIAKIKSTLKLMRNRGPDSSNYFYTKINNKHYYLLHSRLSIIDINKRSAQPYKFKNYIIIFNGEIYNYIEIKKKFFKNIKLDTTSDTEILIRLYDKFRSNCLKYLEGMWSFAILNLANGEMFFSKDRMGEKPFFYNRSGDNLTFGSETKFIKSLSNKKLLPDLNKCKTFLFYGYNFIFKDNKSFFNKINTLPPANFIILKKNVFKIKKYWDLNNIKERSISEKNAVEEIKKLIINSVKLRIRSDVKNSFFLSGGIDSGTVVSIAKKKFKQKITTFSVSDFKSKFYNEKYFFDKVAKDVSAKKFEVKVDEVRFFPTLKNNVKYFNSPVLTINSLLQNKLFNKIKNLGFKTSIGGSGSDEIFAGYYDHPKFFLEDLKKTNFKNYKYNLQKFKKFFFTKIRNPKIKKLEIKKNYYSRINYLDLSFLKNFDIPKLKQLNQKLPFKSFLKNALYMQFHENLYPALYQEDLNAMQNSIENRNPFLDKNLIEFLFSLKAKLFLKDGYTKYLLRKSVRGILINKIRMNREKYGFNASFENFKDFSISNLNKYLIQNKKYISKIITFKNVKQMYKYLNLDDFKNNSELQKFTFRLVSTTEFLKQSYSYK